MKRPIPLILLWLSFTVALPAEETPEMIQLRAGYKAALEKAAKPLRQTYLAELAKLRDGYTRAANLGAANSVQAEIDAVSVDGVMAAVAAKGAPASGKAPGLAVAPTASGKAPDPRWFLGKAWGTGRGTHPRWVFAREGNTGEFWRGTTTKLASFTWVVLESGVVEVTDKVAADGSSSKSYIRFKDRDEAWVGQSPETQDTKLQLE